MKKHEIESLPEPTVGRGTLEETPQRSLKFLRGVGTSFAIRAALGGRGYGEADHLEGWALLHAASGYVPSTPFGATDALVRGAMRDVDAWDEDGFRIVTATLERRYPAIAARVLEGIGPSTGPASIVGVKTLLERLDQLEKGKDKDGHAALALLAKRGIDKDERKRLALLVATAQSATTAGMTEAAETAAARKAAADAHVAALAALRRWYNEWSAIARSCVKRRDYLILLGLAKRKTSKRGAAAADPAAAAGEVTGAS